MNGAKFLKARPALNISLILVWMAVIFAGSSTPEKGIPSLVVPVGKILHLAEYAVLGFLVVPKAGSWKAALLVCIFYAVSDEFHQLFVPGRRGSAVDVLIDSAGASAGIFLASRWLR